MLSVVVSSLDSFVGTDGDIPGAVVSAATEVKLFRCSRLIRQIVTQPHGSRSPACASLWTCILVHRSGDASVQEAPGAGRAPPPCAGVGDTCSPPLLRVRRGWGMLAYPLPVVSWRSRPLSLAAANPEFPVYPEAQDLSNEVGADR